MNLSSTRAHLFTLQLGGLALLLALLTAGAYAMFRNQLRGQLEEKLRLMGQTVTFSVEHEQGQPEFEESLYLASRRERIVLGDEAVAQWLDLQGKLVHSQGRLSVHPSPPRDGHLDYQTHAVVYTLLARDKGQPFGYARVALALGPMQRDLTRLLRDLGIVGAGTLALTALLSWWWTGRVLRPIQAAHDELATFAGAVAHELRTPITALRANSEGVLKHLEKFTPEQIREALKEMHDVSLDMAGIVNDLLLLAQIRRGQDLPTPVALALGTVAADVVSSLQPEAGRRGLQLTCLPSEPSLIVKAAEGHVRMMIRNLVENALHYTPKGGSVRVRLRSDGSDAELLVEDTGIGLSRKELNSVFEPFWRADPSRARHLGGAGLGLAIVSSLARAQGGSTSVESQPGRGSKFGFKLPLA